MGKLHIAVAAMLGLCTTAASALPTDAKSIMSENETLLGIQQAWGFSDAVISGDLVFVSGVVVGHRRADASLEAAYERGFAQLADILKRAGSSWNDVVEITSYHTDLTTQMTPMVAVKNRYVKAPFPAWTAVGVTRLIPDNGLTEIKLIAKRSAAAAGSR